MYFILRGGLLKVLASLWIAEHLENGRPWLAAAATPRYLNEVRFTPWLSLWRSFRELLNHACKSLRSDFHRGGERMIDDHNGQQPGKDQD